MPCDLLGRALLALEGQDNLQARDFARVAKSVCKNEAEISRVVKELGQSGLIERRVILTDKGKRAIEELKKL